MSSGPLNLGIDISNKFNYLLNKLYNSQPYALSMAVIITVREEQLARIVISLVPISIDNLINTNILLYASPALVNSLLVDNFPDPRNTPHLTRYVMDYILMPESIATPGL